MPKPVKKAPKKSTTPKRSADPMLHARQMVAEHMEKAEDTPAANQPIIDPEAVSWLE